MGAVRGRVFASSEAEWGFASIAASDEMPTLVTEGGITRTEGSQDGTGQESWMISTRRDTTCQ
jgi:hypothetical protein